MHNLGLYFGSPIPNSVLGKKALYSGTIWETTPGNTLGEFLFLKTKMGWPLLRLSLVGFYHVWSKAKPYVVVVLWTFLYFFFFLFAQTKMHLWYYVPFYLGYLILVALGLDWFFAKIDEIWRKPEEPLHPKRWNFLKAKTVQTGVLSLFMIFAFLLYFQQMKRTFKLVTVEQMVLEDIHKQMGLWLVENTQPVDTVCAEDIGYLGYYSRRYILDQDGLVSPQAIPFNQERNRLGLLKKHTPPYFLMRFAGPYFSKVIEDEWFVENYRKVATFNTYSLRPEQAKIHLARGDFNIDPYSIYKRILSTD